MDQEDGGGGGGRGDNSSGDVSQPPELDAATKGLESLEVGGGGAELEETPEVSFYPPVYLQRYIRVRDELEKIIEEVHPIRPFPKAVLEVGCAELKMCMYMKSLPTVEKLTFLDVDEDCLEQYKGRVRPLPIDHVKKRETPLVVEVYHGCITKMDPRVSQSTPPIWAVIAIELIEHLHPEVLLGFQKTVFELLAPPVIIVTTPNSEFNVVFKLPEGKFRHWDHKFEWSRDEFESWCTQMCTTYPDYTYTVDGIGKGSVGTESYGCVSQMGIFRKSGPCLFSPESKDSATHFPMDLDEGSSEMRTAPVEDEDPYRYKLIARTEYPFFISPYSSEERVLIEIRYYINGFLLSTSNLEDYREMNVTEASIPLNLLLGLGDMPKDLKTEEQLRNILVSGGYKVTRASDGELHLFVQVPEKEESEDSDESELEEYDRDDRTARYSKFIANPFDLDPEEDWDI